MANEYLKIKDLYDDLGYLKNRESNVPEDLHKMIKHTKFYSFFPNVEIGKIKELSKKIADLDNSEKIEMHHYAEALQYFTASKKEMLESSVNSLCYTLKNFIGAYQLQDFVNDTERKVKLKIYSENDLKELIRNKFKNL